MGALAFPAEDPEKGEQGPDAGEREGKTFRRHRVPDRGVEVEGLGSLLGLAAGNRLDRRLLRGGGRGPRGRLGRARTGDDRALYGPAGGLGIGDRAGRARGGCRLAVIGGPCGAGDLALQAGGELVEHLRRHPLGYAPAELGDAAGEQEVRLDVDPRALALLPQGGDDGGRGRPLAPGLAAGGLEDGAVGGLVGLLELHRALVAHGDRPDLDLYRPRVLAVRHLLLDGGPRQAGGYLLEVQHPAPRLIHGYADRELVVDLHRASF